MADVLSQSEIDALLSALSSGELEPDELEENKDQHKVKPYNFRTPNKFTKDYIRTLELIHENYARTIATYLTGQLRANVKVKIESMEQLTYEEFIRSIPNPTILSIFKLLPLEGSLLFETNPNFVFQVLDILMGGTGVRRFKFKEFSEIDKRIISRINEGLISNLKIAWDDILEVEPSLSAIETNPALNQTLAPSESVAVITFGVEVNKSHSIINMCIPFLAIENILDKLEVKQWFKGRKRGNEEESKTKIKSTLKTVDVNVTGVLGETQVRVDDFLRLSVGDVITLDSHVEDPINVKIEDKSYFIGKPGMIGKKKGIQVLDILDKDVEDDE